MSAAGSGVGQGSHQPAPYPPGPPITDTIHVGESEPLRQKQNVDHKTSKQRYKRKTQGHLPSPSEIIEISDDEPPLKKLRGPIEVQLKELEEENRKLKATLLAAKSLQAKVPSPSLEGQAGRLLHAIQDHVGCGVCRLKMWKPYTLVCGHTFCQSCLQEWFGAAHAHHLSTHPTYDPQRLIPPPIRAQLASGNLPLDQRRRIERGVMEAFITTSYPKYSCPTCRMLIRTKPAENFVIKHLICTVAAVQKESPPAEHSRSLTQAQGPFDGFFPFTLYDLNTT